MYQGVTQKAPNVQVSGSGDPLESAQLIKSLFTLTRNHQRKLVCGIFQVIDKAFEGYEHGFWISMVNLVRRPLVTQNG